MGFDIGRQIKHLRGIKGVTQEELANHLGVSYQAVSKWENEVTSPDIQLLPLISIYFGITIDELFKMPDEAHMERIENMIHNERLISHETFAYAERFLQGILSSEPKNAKVYYLLSALHNHQASSNRFLASEYAKKALEYAPCEKDYHNELMDAEKGVCSDGYYNSHYALIQYYKEFVKKNPKYWSGYFYLIDQLLADGRCDEAKEFLCKAKSLKPSHVYDFYEGDIQLASGNHKGAIELWNRGVNENPQVWQVYLSRADRFVKLCRYEDALKDYKKGFEVQDKPRYVDSLISMAQIYEILGQYEKAINSYKEEIRILKEEHNILTGEIIEKPAREIERLQKLLQKM